MGLVLVNLFVASLLRWVSLLVFVCMLHVCVCFLFWSFGSRYVGFVVLTHFERQLSISAVTLNQMVPSTLS